MDKDALRTYLNDHLAGSTLGVDHARQIEERNEGTPLGDVMARVAADIEADRDKLEQIMERLDVAKNPVKAATAWVAEKAGRVKFSGASAADKDLGNFLALETMSLGVEGKRCLWLALQQVEGVYPELDSVELETLVKRAEEQRATLEAERLAAARTALVEHDAARS
jgi:hypothetical protein